PASLRTQAHDSEPRWCANPFLSGSLIRYSLPAYPGAFREHPIRSRQHIRRNPETDLLSAFKIDDELEVRGLFQRQGSLSRACQGCDIARRGAAAYILNIRSIRH